MWRHKVWIDNPLDEWTSEEQEQMLRGVCFGKGGGNTDPQPTQSTVTQTTLPEYAEPFVTRLMERGEAASNAPYETHDLGRITPYGTDTTTGFQQIRDIAEAGTPAAFTNAETALTGITNADPLAQQDQWGQMESFADSAIADQYMNPYIQNVLDVQKNRANQRFNEQQVAREAAATKAGAFGGSRRFVEDQIANRERNLQLNELEAQGLAQAYQSGSQQFNAEQALEMQRRGLDTQVFDANQQRILDQQAAQREAAEQLRAQGIAADDLAFTRAKTLAGVGGALEDKDQQSLDLAYSDFVNQRDFDKNQLNFYSGILRGVPISPQQETLRYNAPPSQLSQLLGLGLGGLGLAKTLS